MNIYLPYTNHDEEIEEAKNEEPETKELFGKPGNSEGNATDNEQTDNVPELINKVNDPQFEIYSKHARRRSSVKKGRTSRQASNLSIDEINCNLTLPIIKKKFFLIF